MTLGENEENDLSYTCTRMTYTYEQLRTALHDVEIMECVASLYTLAHASGVRSSHRPLVDGVGGTTPPPSTPISSDGPRTLTFPRATPSPPLARHLYSPTPSPKPRAPPPSLNPKPTTLWGLLIAGLSCSRTRPAHAIVDNLACSAGPRPGAIRRVTARSRGHMSPKPHPCGPALKPKREQARENAQTHRNTESLVLCYSVHVPVCV